jgi:hypothetical protein
MPAKKRSAPKTDNRNISEVKYGYLVAYKTKRGPTSKHFAFTKHGGKRATLVAARKFRDELPMRSQRSSNKDAKRPAKKTSPAAATKRGRVTRK